MLGDDCAIVEMADHFLLLTTDMITRASHMPEGARPEDIGWYAAAINLSDIAAMGGEPLGMLFALGLPRDTDSAWLDSLMDGINECAARYGAPILGGDTKENSNPTISGVALGRVPKAEILRRSGARPGDVLAMTGKLGRGIIWERDVSDPAILLRVEPRVADGRKLAKSGAVTSCIDISDGLSTCLHLMSKASNVGFTVTEESIPMEPGLDRDDRARALHWGGDFELLFTARQDKIDEILSIEGVSVIGNVTEGLEISLVRNGKPESLPDRGYEHFGRGTW